MAKTIKLTIIIGMLIISFSVLYYLVIWPEQKEKALENCLLEAKQKYDEKWITTCHSLFSEQVIQQYSDEELCKSLAAEHADPIIEYYQTVKNDCFRQYSR